jgi:hypothetical protein
VANLNTVSTVLIARPKEIIMNAKLIAALFVTAVIGSASAFAGQSSGRDSVYATPGSHSSKPTVVAVNPRHGRSSVYVGDTAAPQTRSTVADTVIVKPGRA